MKIKKILMYIGIILALALVVVLGFLVNINKNAEKNNLEITPEEEISSDQLRQTIITLYFMDKETGELEPEARQIDARMLLQNPYKVLVDMLIEGPKNEQLVGLIPEKTKLNNVELEKDIVCIDFSDDFIKEQNLGEKQEKLMVDSIMKTLIELSEVNGIKILINGEENLEFPDGGLKFDSIFYKE